MAGPDPQIPRKPLGFFPTPLVELPRLAARLGGPRLWMKRDDQTGLGMGGNKVRKLEFLVAEALARGCDTLVTGGAEQSNHCRQTAAAAAACGLECHLVLGGAAPAEPGGNLLLDMLLGARIHWAGRFRKGETIPRIAAQLEAAGRAPCVIPYGGSNATGAAGFAHAARELVPQIRDAGARITHVVFPSSSGGTQAGLAAGARMLGQSFRIVGIGIDKGEAGDAPYAERLAQLASDTAKLFGRGERFAPDDFDVRTAYTGGGYGVVGNLEREAIRLTAETEGILLDPVYTGRAMGALIDMIRRGEFTRDDAILFWHTGGTPALFAYGSKCAELSESRPQNSR